MPFGVRIGRIAGVEIRVDWSLTIIFALVAVSLSAGIFPAWHPEWSTALSWATGLAAAVLFFVSVLLHELSHALVGRAQGIPVSAITLFVFGGMAHTEKDPERWRAELWMALVGPLTSLALGVIFIVLANLMAPGVEMSADDPREALSQLGPVATLLTWLGPINILLGLFNLVPGFPLDGGRVLRAALWGITGNLRRATRWASRAGQGFAWVLIASGVLMMLGQEVPVFGRGVVGGLWLAFIGWFLNSAALMSYRQLLVRESLEEVPVSRVMSTELTTVHPGTTLQELADELLTGGDQRSFPVVEDGRFLGLISLHEVRKVPRDARAGTTVGEVMTPAADLATVGREADAQEAMSALGARDVNQVPVVQDGKLQGLVRRQDIIHWLARYTEAPLPPSR